MSPMSPVIDPPAADSDRVAAPGVMASVESVTRRLWTWSLIALVADVILAGLVCAGLLIAFDYRLRFAPGMLRAASSATWWVTVCSLAGVRLWPLLQRNHLRQRVVRAMEQRYPQLTNSLSAALDFERQLSIGSGTPASQTSVQLRQRVVATVRQEIAGLDLTPLVDTQRARSAAIAAGLLMAGVLVSLLVAPTYARTGWVRLFSPLNDRPWPARYRLEMAKLPKYAVANEKLTVEVRSLPATLPRQVQLEVVVAGRSVADGVSAPSGELLEARMLQPLTLEPPVARATLTLGDSALWLRAVGEEAAATPWSLVRVITPPELTACELTLAWPPYTRRGSHVVPWNHLSVLSGTEVSLHGQFAQPVHSAQLIYRPAASPISSNPASRNLASLDQASSDPASPNLASRNRASSDPAEPHRRAEVRELSGLSPDSLRPASIGASSSPALANHEPVVLTESGTLEILVRMSADQPYVVASRRNVQVHQDQPPQVQWLNSPIEFATPQAELDLPVQVMDDLGLSAYQLVVGSSSGPELLERPEGWIDFPLEAPPANAWQSFGTAEWPVVPAQLNIPWRLESHSATPGQALIYRVVVRDHAGLTAVSPERRVRVLSRLELERWLQQRFGQSASHWERLLEMARGIRAYERARQGKPITVVDGEAWQSSVRELGAQVYRSPSGLMTQLTALLELARQNRCDHGPSLVRLKKAHQRFLAQSPTAFARLENGLDQFVRAQQATSGTPNSAAAQAPGGPKTASGTAPSTTHEEPAAAATPLEVERSAAELVQLHEVWLQLGAELARELRQSNEVASLLYQLRALQQRQVQMATQLATWKTEAIAEPDGQPSFEVGRADGEPWSSWAAEQLAWNRTLNAWHNDVANLNKRTVAEDSALPADHEPLNRALQIAQRQELLEKARRLADDLQANRIGRAEQLQAQILQILSAMLTEPTSPGNGMAVNSGNQAVPTEDEATTPAESHVPRDGGASHSAGNASPNPSAWLDTLMEIVTEQTGLVRELDGWPDGQSTGDPGALDLVRRPWSAQQRKLVNRWQSAYAEARLDSLSQWVADSAGKAMQAAAEKAVGRADHYEIQASAQLALHYLTSLAAVDSAASRPPAPPSTPDAAAPPAAPSEADDSATDAVVSPGLNWSLLKLLQESLLRDTEALAAAAEASADGVEPMPGPPRTADLAQRQSDLADWVERASPGELAPSGRSPQTIGDGTTTQPGGSADPNSTAPSPTAPNPADLDEELDAELFPGSTGPAESSAQDQLSTTPANSRAAAADSRAGQGSEPAAAGSTRPQSPAGPSDAVAVAMRRAAAAIRRGELQPQAVMLQRQLLVQIEEQIPAGSGAAAGTTPGSGGGSPTGSDENSASSPGATAAGSAGGSNSAQNGGVAGGNPTANGTAGGSSAGNASGAAGTRSAGASDGRLPAGWQRLPDRERQEIQSSLEQIELPGYEKFIQHYFELLLQDVPAQPTIPPANPPAARPEN